MILVPNVVFVKASYYRLLNVYKTAKAWGIADALAAKGRTDDGTWFRLNKLTRKSAAEARRAAGVEGQSFLPIT